MVLKMKVKLITILVIVLLIIVLALFGKGSQLINNYNPSDGVSYSTGIDEDAITYNNEVLNEVMGGYSGPPTLVASDDKVFYIPPGYCDGSYLRNFRVIGVNQSTADFTYDSAGDITDYSGVVVLYGFQTTYKEDYGSGYDFDYEPYDYDVEYEVVNSFFDDVIIGGGDASDYISGDGEEDGEVSYDLYLPGTVTAEKNKNVVDDSEFKVATIVMEHEIGKDECKILYCDADSATVEDLDEGRFNLVTNLSNDALTICFNEKMFVYRYDESACTYGSKDVYYYDLNDFFDSVTYKNSLVEAGYCSVKYNATGIIKFDNNDITKETWVQNWLKYVDTENNESLSGVAYLSNLSGDTAAKGDVHKNIMDMESYLADEIEEAYSGYKKTPSGWFSFKHSTSVESFGNYSFKNLSNDSWTLTTTFEVEIYEKSLYGIFPKGYTANPTGTITITIVPEYIIDAEYNYTIDDLILTKYESTESTDNTNVTTTGTAADTTAVSLGSSNGIVTPTDVLNSMVDRLNGSSESSDTDSGETEDTTTQNKYSMVLQLMITPVEEGEEEDQIDPIEDFEQYRQDVLNEVDVDTTPDGVDEDELEDYDEDDEVSSDSEETVKSAVSAKYLTFNVNLSQVSGTSSGEKINILTITDANELKEEIDSLKEKYLDEYNQNVAKYATETKSGGYVIPKDFTVDTIEDFKLQFAEIKACREAIEAAKAKLEELYAALEEEYENKETNAETVNAIVDSYGLSDKKSYGDLGYYSDFEDELEAMNILGEVSADTDVRSLYTSISAADALLYNSCLGLAASQAESLFGSDEGDYGKYIVYAGDDLSLTTAEGKTRVLSFCSYLNTNTSGLNPYVYTLLSKMGTYANSQDSEALTETEIEDLIYLYEETEFLKEFTEDCTTYFGGIYLSAQDLATILPSVSSLQSNISKYTAAYLSPMEINYAAAVYNSFMLKTDSEGISLLTYLQRMNDIFTNINSYEMEQIPELEAQIAELEEELERLKNVFDTTSFALDFYWNGTAVTGDFLDENIDSYDEITANLDEYMSAYNTLLAVDDYRESADSVVSNIETLNTDSNINRIIDDMYDAISMDTGAGGYESYSDDVKYIKSIQNKFYYNISTALNSAANIYGAETDTTVVSEEDENTNIRLIKEGIEAFYGSMGKNTINARTYTQIAADSESIYKGLYDSFTKVSTVIDGEDVTVCDVTADTVLKYIYEYLIDNYGITVLTYVDEEGVERTTTIAKNNESSGNISIEDETEATTDDSSSDGYEQNLYAVYRSYSQILSYAENLKGIYDNLLGLAIKLFYGSGCLTEEQIALFDADPSTADQDVTSDYNVGFMPAYNICEEMPELVKQVKIYYDTRAQAAAVISAAASKGMTVVLRDDRYYSYLYKEKCSQADYLYKLFYNAAKAATDAERQEVVEEFNSKTDWLILDDIEVDKELTSVMKVETETITTTYQNVTWNTALINTDVENKIESLVTDDAYEMYQMDANFIVIINAERGYVVPMGAQADSDVSALNTKIKEEISERKIGDIENVAYGTDNSSGYQILLFSSASGWFMITFKQTESTDGTITIDRNNVLGYYGKYSTGGTDDAHFLEYDHTNITGLNQFYSTTIENGFIPYDINLSSSGSSTIEPAVEFVENDAENPVSEIAAGSVGVEGAFFNAWTFTSNNKGNVILLGYKLEDMEIAEETETETEAATEITTYYSSEDAAEEMAEDETAAEKTYREIVDSDIYEARLYVYQYDTKAASAEADYSWDEEDYYNLEYGMLSDEVANLTGPYGELVKTPVILLEYARVPILILVYALLAVYCIYLGVKYATSGDDEGKKIEAKRHLRWFIIGVLTIHILMGFMYCTYRQLKSWQEDIAVETGTDEKGLKNW
ncbi:MAG: pilin [Clostridiales bacterium]|nr:pilin [Clostridiales bacterium]